MLYDIASVSILTGIKPHSLRIWEQRYNLVHPKRTETGIRQYTDEDLKILLNVKMLLKEGMKISKVAELTEEERRSFILRQMEKEDDENQYSYFINEFLKAAIDLDDINFDKFFSRCVDRWGFETTILHVVYPVLKKVGILWGVDKISPVEEHFFSQLVIQRMHEAISLLPFPTSSQRQFILFLPQGQHHEIPLLLANYTLRKKGCRTIYLGADVPLEGLKRLLKSKNISNPVLLSFYVIRQEDLNVKFTKEILDILEDRATLWIGGESHNVSAIENHLKDVRLLTYDSYDSFLEIVNKERNSWN